MSSSRSHLRRTPLLFVSLGRRFLATHAAAGPSRLSAPQTFIEKITQRYAVDVPPGKAVKAGDYISLKPECAPDRLFQLLLS